MRIYPIFIQLSLSWTCEDFPHSHVFKSQLVNAHNTEIYYPSDFPFYASACKLSKEQTELHESVIIVKITQSRQTNYFDFDGQNMMHTQKFY
jgi:hypothetical protein